MRIFKSVALQYVIIRYISYVLTFINTILILRFIGDYYYGIYSFFILFLSYFVYFNLGVNHSLNTYMSIYKNNQQMIARLWDNSLLLTWLFTTMAIIVGGGILYFFPNLFAKYDFKNYGIILFLIGILANINSIFISLFRVFGKFREINFQQIAPQILVLGIVLYFQEKTKISYVLYAMLATQLASLIIFCKRKVLKFSCVFSGKISKILICRGIHLMIQLFSFTFISLSAITMVSCFYRAEDLGYYSLSNTISVSVVMLIDTFMFILYPKLLNRFASSTNEGNIYLIDKIRKIYILGADCISLLSLMIIPIVFIFFPHYGGMISCFKLLTISRIILNVTNGYTQLLIAKHKETYMTLSGIKAIGIILVISCIIGMCEIPYYYIALTVCLGILVYSILIVKEAFNILGIDKKMLLAKLFPINKLIAILIILISFVVNDNIYSPIIAIGYYFIVNKQDIQTTIITSFRTLMKKEILSI
ncbi:MAG: oligosaccharide flippase family protein [Bacteroidales bacterium]|nr:oligosaccharide flippase family protein [Bacteroidales bacterium]